MTNADETPPSGGYEAPPIEQSEPPAYLPPPAFDYPPPPPAGYLPPPVYPQSAGYQAPGYPPPPYGSFSGYPQATPGYPAYPGYPGYPGGYGPPRTNQLAIWSLVTSALGFVCCLGSVVGVVLGLIALNQIRERQEGGRGLAIAGIAVGGVSLLIGLVVIGAVSST